MITTEETSACKIASLLGEGAARFCAAPETYMCWEERVLRTFLRKSRKDIAFFFLVALAWTGINVIQAFLLEFISETALQGISGRLGIIVVWALGYVILEAALEFAFSCSELNVRSKISALFRNALMQRILECGIEEKESKGDGYYLAMVNDQVNEVETDYVGALLNVICQLFFLMFALAATTSIQPMMTLIVIVLCILPLGVPRFFRKRLESTKRDSVAAKSRYVDLLNELMAGFTGLKIFHRSTDVSRYHDQANEDARKSVLRSRVWQRMSMSASYGLGNLVVLGGWVFGVIFAVAGAITVPEMIALTSLMNLVAGPFQIISENYSAILSGRAVVKDLEAFLESGNHATDSYKSDAEMVFSLALSHGTVVRDGRKILDDVSVQLERGKKICVVGASGSGKSTLLRTMAGILEMQGGTLSVNGENVAGKPGLTHQALLYLTQDTTIFSASIGNNVSLFRKMPEETLRKSLLRSGLGAWFHSAGDHLDKFLEKNSAKLSGGEQRRFDFARVLAEDGKILLFDEPTAGLDAANAQNIMNQIAAMDGRMVMVATHDLEEENLRHFDEVYILEAGRAALHGAPDFVFASKQYQKLKTGSDTD